MRYEKKEKGRKENLATLPIRGPPLCVNVRKGNGIFIFIKMQKASKSENRSSLLLPRSKQEQKSVCILPGVARGFSDTVPLYGIAAREETQGPGCSLPMKDKHVPHCFCSVLHSFTHWVRMSIFVCVEGHLSVLGMKRWACYNIVSLAEGTDGQETVTQCFKSHM